MRKPYVKKKAEFPTLSEIKEPEWDNIVKELLSRGFSKAGLANRCEMARETLVLLMNGNTSPRWYAGQKLLQIHREVVSRQITSEALKSWQNSKTSQ